MNSLKQLFLDFYNSWKPQEDLNPFLFQQQYSLRVDIPKGWEYIDAIRALISVCSEDKSRFTGTDIVIIYPNSDLYREFYSLAGDNASYFSWQELHVAMDRANANKDRTELSKHRELLSNARLTIFVSPPVGYIEVVDQVYGMCINRLIVIGVQ